MDIIKDIAWILLPGELTNGLNSRQREAVYYGALAHQPNSLASRLGGWVRLSRWRPAPAAPRRADPSLSRSERSVGVSLMDTRFVRPFYNLEAFPYVLRILLCFSLLRLAVRNFSELRKLFSQLPPNKKREVNNGAGFDLPSRHGYQLIETISPKRSKTRCCPLFLARDLTLCRRGRWILEPLMTPEIASRNSFPNYFILNCH